MPRWTRNCFQWFKDTNLRANHNPMLNLYMPWSDCFQWFKDTNLRANHNPLKPRKEDWTIVFNGSKILIWEQITTILLLKSGLSNCFQWFKDTNLRANHNVLTKTAIKNGVVFNGSKMLIWEQITTDWIKLPKGRRCLTVQKISIYG